MRSPRRPQRRCPPQPPNPAGSSLYRWEHLSPLYPSLKQPCCQCLHGKAEASVCLNTDCPTAAMQARPTINFNLSSKGNHRQGHNQKRGHGRSVEHFRNDARHFLRRVWGRIQSRADPRGFVVPCALLRGARPPTPRGERGRAPTSLNMLKSIALGERRERTLARIRRRLFRHGWHRFSRFDARPQP